MSTTTANLGLFKYDTTTDGNVAFNIDTALNNNWDKIDEAISNSGGARNIGEIVTSTIPLTDAGLHLLDGSLIQGDGIYSDFVDYIAGLVSTYPDLFVTESDWQQSITNYGVCGKFVYDSVNNTVRLPKYSNKIYTQDLTSTVPVKGNGMTLGLTNGTNNYGFIGYGGGAYGIISQYGEAVKTGTTTGSNMNGNIGLTTDSSKSGVIADLSNITTSLEGYYYIVVATSTKTNIQVDIDEIVTDLNGKADRDLLNLSDTGNIQMAGASMPSDTYVNLTLGASGTNYIAPANGWYFIQKNSNQANQYIWLKNITVNMYALSQNNLSDASNSLYIPAYKGDTIQITYNLGGATAQFKFIYAKGSESEAQ